MCRSISICEPICPRGYTEKSVLSKSEMEKYEKIKKIIEAKKIKENENISVCEDVNEPFKGDLLAIVTQHTKDLFYYLSDLKEKLKKTTAYAILTKTTQPAHVIAIFITSLVIYVLWPNLTGHSLPGNPKTGKTVFSIIIYLGAFATHFGAQIWMTFVSGLALYFSLPRHTFGLCQQILFPKYYGLGAALSFVTLITYVKSNSTNLEKSSYFQIIVLAVCAFVELIIRLYLAPPLLDLMHTKHQLEYAAGTGQEVGKLVQGGGLKTNEEYQKVHKKFRKIHCFISVGNIVSLVCTIIHLEFLASKINFQ